MSHDAAHDPLRPHAHDPNLVTPPGDGRFEIVLPGRGPQTIQIAALRALPTVRLENCYIVSTGHGTSGPFTFEGPTLLALIRAHLPDDEWTQVEVISADGFGNRVTARELLNPDPAGPIALAHTLDGAPLRRDQGLVRLIVPSERDDALRQVKWVGRIRLRR